MSVIGELVQNVIETDYKAFSTANIACAIERIIDTVGCALGGAKAPGCAELIDLVCEWGGAEEASILGFTKKVPTHHAALVNSVMARSYDFEPAGPVVDGKSTPSHLCGTTVPTAISVAEACGAGGKELLTALILGDDMASRVIAASELNLDSGFEPTGTANAFGSTAIAGKLLKLNQDQMLNAFGIVINQFGGTFQNIFDGAHSFKLPQGLSAQAGVFATKLAAKGFTGVRDPLFSQYGYFNLYCKDYHLSLLTKNLGKAFYADNTYKPYPCCRSNHAAIDCTLGILKVEEIPLENIDEVIVSISQKAKNFAVGQHFKIRDVAQIDAAFSIQYSVANALLRKCVKLEHYTDAFIRDPRISDLIPRIRLINSIPKEQPLASEVKIKMKNGVEYAKKIDIPRGNETYTPLTMKEKRDKFIDNVLFSGMQKEKGASILNMVSNIEELDKVSRLTQHIA
jgi:2-methylcitrate dehydratase PrpD